MREEVRLDRLVLNGATDPSSVITPSQIYSEIRAFNNRFSPAVFQASFNLLRLHKVSDTWRTGVVVVTLKRVPNLGPKSKAWARHAIDTVEQMSPQTWARTSGEGPAFLIMKPISEQELFKRGDKVGVITYITKAPCMDLNVKYLYTTSTIGYEADSEKTLDRRRLRTDVQEHSRADVRTLFIVFASPTYCCSCHNDISSATSINLFLLGQNPICLCVRT